MKHHRPGIGGPERFNDLKRTLPGGTNAAGVHLPTEQEINPDGNSYDGQSAVDHFLEKTREQISREWYLPAVVDYVTTDAIRDDNDAVSDLCRVVESRLEYHLPEVREAFPEMLRFADYVLEGWMLRGHNFVLVTGCSERRKDKLEL